MTIRHHPDLSSLMCCAAGSQPEAFAAVIASHLSVCADCRAEVGRMQQIGVALFDALPPADVVSGAPVVAMRAGEAGAGVVAGFACGSDPVTTCLIVTYLGTLVSVLGARWTICRGAGRRRGSGPIPYRYLKHADGELLLIKVAPGKEMPEHGHTGQELTMILRGGYTDKLGTYGVGDVADLDSDVEHTPVACATEGCICLSARDGKLRFKSAVARLLQPLIGL